MLFPDREMKVLKCGEKVVERMSAHFIRVRSIVAHIIILHHRVALYLMTRRESHSPLRWLVKINTAGERLHAVTCAFRDIDSGHIKWVYYSKLSLIITLHYGILCTIIRGCDIYLSFLFAETVRRKQKSLMEIREENWHTSRSRNLARLSTRSLIVESTIFYLTIDDQMLPHSLPHRRLMDREVIIFLCLFPSHIPQKYRISWIGYQGELAFYRPRQNAPTTNTCRVEKHDFNKHKKLWYIDVQENQSFQIVERDTAAREEEINKCATHYRLTKQSKKATKKWICLTGVDDYGRMRDVL